MKIKIQEGKYENIETELLIIGSYEDELTTIAKEIDQKLNKDITKAIQKKEFTGEFGQIKILSTSEKIKARNILIAGLGKKEKLTIGLLKKAIASSARTARDLVGVKNFITTIHQSETKEKNTLGEKIQAVTEGILLGTYRFLKYKTQKLDKIKKLESATIIVEKKDKDIEKAFEKGKIISEATMFARDLVNEPGSSLGPEEFSKIIKKEAQENGIKITIMNKKEIEKKGLKGLLAVNRGSEKEPRFIVIEYGNQHKKKIALVGKGVTFDSGGLDIKTSAGMDTMKSDMAGAATVAATTLAAAKLKLKINLFCVMGLTENMPGHNAYKPGDVVETYSGKTIEILNTDAEGRVTLADSLAYAEKNIKPEAIIDLATLTGACVVALGSVASGIMGDKEIIEKIKDASKETGEKVWELPLWEEYLQQVSSEIADVRNLGLYAREAGAITAGAFLKNFVEKTPWAHIDIAGTAFTKEEKELTKKGGTGWGVKLLTKMLEDWQ